MLIDEGADVNTLYEGEPVLHFAISKGNLEIVKALVDAKAQLDNSDKWGCTPLHKSLLHGFETITKFLIKSKALFCKEPSFILNLPQIPAILNSTVAKISLTRWSRLVVWDVRLGSPVFTCEVPHNETEKKPQLTPEDYIIKALKQVDKLPIFSTDIDPRWKYHTVQGLEDRNDSFKPLRGRGRYRSSTSTRSSDKESDKDKEKENRPKDKRKTNEKENKDNDKPKNNDSSSKENEKPKHRDSESKEYDKKEHEKKGT